MVGLFDWLYGKCNYMQGYDTEPCGSCCPQCQKHAKEAKMTRIIKLKSWGL